MSRRARTGVFCLENWSSSLRDRSSVKGLLKLMESRGAITFCHDRVHTVEEFNLLMRKWGQAQYRSYRIGYLAFHGSSGMIHMGRRSVSLEELAELMNGACKGKILHFGSCSVLDVGRAEIEAFRKAIDARCVMGYTSDVDWMVSTAFDLIVFDRLTNRVRLDAVERDLKAHKELARSLGFRMYYGQPARRAPK